MCLCCCIEKVSVHDVLSVIFIDAHVVWITFWRQAAICQRLHLPLSKTLFISLPGHRDISDERELTSGLSKVLAHIWIVSSNHNSTSKWRFLFIIRFSSACKNSCKVIQKTLHRGEDLTVQYSTDSFWLLRRQPQYSKSALMIVGSLKPHDLTRVLRSWGTCKSVQGFAINHSFSFIMKWNAEKEQIKRWRRIFFSQHSVDNAGITWQLYLITLINVLLCNTISYNSNRTQSGFGNK